MRELPNMVKCEQCGEEYGIGEWMWCPHGVPHFHVDAHEPQHHEMISTGGETFTSAREKQKYMDRHGIVEREDRHSMRSPAGGKIAKGALNTPMFVDMGSKQ